jgi:hypothetical protein
MDTRPQLGPAERFLTKVRITADCWTWIASTNDNGYGQFYVGEQKFSAHRWSYELLVGPVPDGKELDHLCRNRACVRPSHLEPVTHLENVRRSQRALKIMAKTHCPNGHPYNVENTGRGSRGTRRCLTCHRDQARGKVVPGAAAVRIQRRRVKGWRAPAGAAYAGRGTRWGNPNQVVRTATGWAVNHDNGSSVGTFPSDLEARRFAVEAYRAHLKAHPELVDLARSELAGRALMCWCPLPADGEPDHCHAAVLLELANQPAATPA